MRDKKQFEQRQGDCVARISIGVARYLHPLVPLDQQPQRSGRVLGPVQARIRVCRADRNQMSPPASTDGGPRARRYPKEAFSPSKKPEDRKTKVLGEVQIRLRL